ncbi:MAG: permease-like cell division protein FtsX [Oscillospiraceae bacterium]|nr:permease-like cell division protein FtsX [Oscillospiraceae bacterium]
MRISSIGYLVKQGTTSVWKNRMMSFASFCILLVSLMLVGFSVLVGINISSIVSGIEDKNEIVVILHDDISQEQTDNLFVQIKELSNVSNVEFYSKEEAWKSIVEDMTEEEKSFMQYAENDNPLPDTYRVKVSDLELMDITTSQLKTFGGVESVQSPTEFASALVSIRNIVALVSSTVVFALVVVCLVIISNTTRASVHARRKEINIMKYVGATNTFIRVPFFIEGMLIGIISAVGALILTRFAYNELYTVLNDQLKLMNIIGTKSLYAFDSIALPVTVCYLAAGTLIGALGTTISTGKYLKV